MNDLQIITEGAGDDEIKLYTGRTDSRARSEGEFPSGDPDFQRRDGKHVRNGNGDNFRNRKSIRRENALVSAIRKIFGVTISEATAAAIILVGKYALLFMVYTIIVCSLSARNARIKATNETAARYEAQIAAYMAEQEEAAHV